MARDGTDTASAHPARPSRAPLSRADNPLIRAVQRTPSGVQSKLLVALLGAVGLLVIVGLLGIRAIADSNNRAEALRALQQRATAYRALLCGLSTRGRCRKRTRPEKRHGQLNLFPLNRCRLCVRHFRRRM